MGHASASLHLSLHTGPLTTDGLRVLGGGPRSTDTAQTWPALVEQLAQPLAQPPAQPLGPGVELRLASKRERMRSWHIYRRGESVVVAHLSLRLQPKKP